MSNFFNAIVTICRTVVGALFVVSGLIKSNDVLGFVYKLEEYFEPGAMNLEFLTPYALELAIFVVVSEILLGVAILVGALPRHTAVLTTVMMVFFTWLTWYTASCDPYGVKEIMGPDGVVMTIANQCVLECGCFGNAIPLTAIQSFYKDVVLLVLVLPIVIAAFRDRIKLNDSNTSMVIYTGASVLTFLFGYLMLDWNFPTLYLVLLLLAASAIRRRAKTKNIEWKMAAGALVVICVVQFYTLNYLPLKDYRPYAVDQNIIENRKSAEELGLKGPEYATKYQFKNLKTGVDTIILSTDYLKVWNDSVFKSTYEVVSYDGEEVKISDGYEPLILDFQMIDSNGEDLADSLLNSSKILFLHVSKDLENSGAKNQARFNVIANKVLEQGHNFYGLSNVGYDISESYKHEHQAPYEFLTCDQTELKIVVRANPGLVAIKDGVVIGKWSASGLPSNDEIDSLLRK
jgi:uncharacterized membrane protein YphA (DoxX/SURF4 family)